MTDIETGRAKFLKLVDDGFKRLNKMEEEMDSEDYKAKYKKLLKNIKELEQALREELKWFPEPEWPDAIDDRKKVIWYWNDVFNHAYAMGELGICLLILDMAEET